MISSFETGAQRDVQCRRLIERCGYAAAALTILPIPGSEVIGVMPLHVGMVIGIGEAHGVEITRETAVELLSRIGATVGLSLVGSRLAMTAGKIILPGLGGLVAAPFMFASTLALGTVARLYFESGGRLGDSEMKRAYESEVRRAKGDFDPRRARSNDARAHAEEAVRDAQAPEPAAPATVDELATRLAKLDELRDLGRLSEVEHEAQKKRILDSI